MSRSKLQVFLGISKSSPRAGKEGHHGDTPHLLKLELGGSVCTSVCKGLASAAPPSLRAPRAPWAHSHGTHTKQPSHQGPLPEATQRLWPPGGVGVAAARGPNRRIWLGLLECPLWELCPWSCCVSQTYPVHHRESGFLLGLPVCLSLIQATSDMHLLCVAPSPSLGCAQQWPHSVHRSARRSGSLS